MPEIPAENSFGQPIGRALPEREPPAFPEKVPLTGRYCRLEPLEARAHAKHLFEAFAEDDDGSNWTYLPYGPFSTVEEFEDWVKSSCAVEDPQFYTLIDKISALPAGVASYLRIEPRVGSIEVGHIHFSRRLRKGPAATEAMFLMMKRVFDLGYRRYEWKCDQLNAPSCAAAQRLGFSFEGVLRQATMYKGRNRDTAWFSMVDADWPDLENAFSQWLAQDNFDENGVQRVALRELTRSLLTPAIVPGGVER